MKRSIESERERESSKVTLAAVSWCGNNDANAFAQRSEGLYWVSCSRSRSLLKVEVEVEALRQPQQHFYLNFLPLPLLNAFFIRSFHLHSQLELQNQLSSLTRSFAFAFAFAANSSTPPLWNSKLASSFRMLHPKLKLKLDQLTVSNSPTTSTRPIFARHQVVRQQVALNAPLKLVFSPSTETVALTATESTTSCSRSLTGRSPLEEKQADACEAVTCCCSLLFSLALLFSLKHS